MTISEAIERIKTMAFMCDDFHNCKYGHDCTVGCSEAVKMAVDALQESVKKKCVGKDNMVISSSDLMTILNSDSEELKQYKEVGTVEEFKALKDKNTPYKPKEYEDRYYACKCGNILLPKWRKYPTELMPKSEGLPHCLACGQKLDWSE